MTAKAKQSTAAALAGRITTKWEPPTPLEGATLLEQGLLCVLTRRLSRSQAEATIKSLRQEFFDWNELRVAQVQEIVPLVAARGKNGAGLLIARDIKEYLQEVFQKNHGFDLEFLREDLAAAGKLLVEFEFLGAVASHYLLWVAGKEEFPVSLELVRVFDRLGLIGRTASLKKARIAIEPLIPAGQTLEFAMKFASVVESWCDRKKPECWDCPLLDQCPHGKKVYRDWKAQQERLEAQRVREAARAATLEKKELARQAREDARRKREAQKLQKKLERDQGKREREKERKRLVDEKKKRQEEKAKKREQAAKDAAKAKPRITKSKAKKSAAKAPKKPAAKKATKKPAKKVTKKPVTKKPVTKRPATKRPATKRPSTKRPSTKRPSTKRPSTKRPSTKKPATRKATKKPAKKPAKKVTKKPTTRKKR